MGSETIRNRRYEADCQTSRKEMARVLKPFDLQGLFIFLCIKVALVTDMTMGTSQMLSCMEERIHDLNPEIEVTCFGQEFNPSTFAIAKADMMIRGGNPDNMRFGDTLSDDQFTDYTFRYIISNPPFGIDWKREQKAV